MFERDKKLRKGFSSQTGTSSYGTENGNDKRMTNACKIPQNDL